VSGKRGKRYLKRQAPALARARWRRPDVHE
jgi:hypothetical protein